ncbi:MAG: glycosyltransferase family 9 protein [Gammaproteobacteria bacterium]|nr:glycosyltransferase family 9 protein [Gammaproteobacteria bacterium]
MNTLPKKWPKKILVVRNDKLGDFMLSFPTFALLKQSLPNTEIHALVPEYTQPMAEACEFIDHIVLDPGKDNNIWQLVHKLRQQNYDAVITLFSTTRVGFAANLAGIPVRIAPATKLAQVFYNHRLKQRRSRSEKAEYIYNRDLAAYYLHLIGLGPVLKTQPPYLHFEESHVAHLRNKFCQKNQIPAKNKLIFIHPGSGGSAGNLSISQFAKLAQHLQSSKPFTIVISCGPAEFHSAETMAKLLPKTPHVIYLSEQGLRRFAEHLQFADLFISGSTGTLHVAGALNVPTVGFYTRRRSAISSRWQTLNSDNYRLAFSPPENAEEEDMSSIDIKEAAKQISEKFLLKT